ncbi:unnamed protein product [Heligmosomoides polygyrus]|uniref:DDE_3 domain-containing protein n=1 Tax=Heligmosomoides polygyrus TaxID=6339 RepID=A0A183FH35_HELPZ|nr:unnamed protein product [Heligmosomoides polygyrus]
MPKDKKKDEPNTELDHVDRNLTTGHLLILESHLPGYWTKDFWPPNSPDLSPMDFAEWGYLQQKSHQSLNALKASLQKAWDDIDVTFLRPTVMSVEERLKACIAAKGAHFEHVLE